jgi:hypothetical protein
MQLNLFKQISSSFSVRGFAVLSFILAIIIYLINLNLTHTRINKKHWFAVTIVYLIVCFLRLLNYGSLSISDLYIFVSYLLAISIINCREYINEEIVYFSYLVICAYFIFRFFSAGTLDNIFVFFSHNYVSLILTYNLLFLHYIQFSKTNKLSLLPAILYLFISILAVGRSGIILSFSYLVFVISYNFIKISLYKKITILTLSIIFISIVSLPDIDFKLLSPRIASMGIRYEDDIRKQLLNAYISNIDYISILFGMNINNIPLISQFDNNPHNSFIVLHAATGFLFFPLVIIIIVKYFSYIIRKNIVFIICLSLLLIRINLDQALFFSAFDFILYLFLFYVPTSQKEIVNKSIV